MRTILHHTLSILLYTSIVSAAPLLPYNPWYYSHGELLQRYINFLAVNFLTHVGTIPGTAGGKWRENMAWGVIALFLPLAGLWRSCIYISNHAMLHRSSVEKACARGAVVALARDSTWAPSCDDWERVCVSHHDIQMMERKGTHTKATIKILYGRPSDGSRDNVLTRLLEEQSVVDIDHYDFGDRNPPQPPDGYTWILLENPTVIAMLLSSIQSPDEIKVRCYRSSTKMILSIIQLLYASAEIYQSIGRQIQTYGYAAYGLTVFPFTMMSLMNLCTEAITGEYPARAVLRSHILEEAELRDKRFRCEYAMGDLKPEDSSRPTFPINSLYPPAPLQETFTPMLMRIEQRSDQRELHIRRIDSREKDKFKCYLLCSAGDDVDALTIGVSAYTNQLSPCHSILTHPSNSTTIVLSPTVMVALVSIAAFALEYVLPYWFFLKLTGFEVGESTLIQRIWPIGAIVSGQVGSFFVWFWMRSRIPTHRLILTYWGFIFIILLVFPIGQYVSITDMYFRYNYTAHDGLACV